MSFRKLRKAIPCSVFNSFLNLQLGEGDWECAWTEHTGILKLGRKGDQRSGVSATGARQEERYPLGRGDWVLLSVATWAMLIPSKH